MMADPSMNSSGPPGQSTQISMGQRDPQKHGGGYHQMPTAPRGPPHPNARLSGPPGYVDDMSMEMGHMNVTSPSSYNPNNFSEFYDGSI